MDAPLWVLKVFDLKNQFGEPPFSFSKFLPCRKQCQNEDWPRHKLICQDIRNKYLELEKSREIIQSYVKQASSNNEGPQLTFKVLLQEIQRALFTAYFSVIESTNHFNEQLNEWFCIENKSQWIPELRSLQRKRYKHLKVSSKKLESQIISSFVWDKTCFS